MKTSVALPENGVDVKVSKADWIHQRVFLHESKNLQMKGVSPLLLNGFNITTPCQDIRMLASRNTIAIAPERGIEGSSYLH